MAERRIEEGDLPGVSLVPTSAKGEGGLAAAAAAAMAAAAWADGETHIGAQRRRLLGRPWLCTGSNSRDRLRVAQAILALRPAAAACLHQNKH